MSTNPSKTSIIVAVISALAIIIVALIQVHPWKKETVQVEGKSKAIYQLSGTVIDEQSNKNVSQAEIDVVGRNEQYYSEENGNFAITVKDSIKSIRIRVVKNGYIPYDKSYDLPNENVIIQLTKVHHD